MERLNCLVVCLTKPCCWSVVSQCGVNAHAVVLCASTCFRPVQGCTAVTLLQHPRLALNSVADHTWFLQCLTNEPLQGVCL